MLPGTWQSADPLIPRQGEDPHAVVAGVIPNQAREDRRIYQATGDYLNSRCVYYKEGPKPATYGAP
jgi:hypothetical protein